jgi:hypothetical protein
MRSERTLGPLERVLARAALVLLLCDLAVVGVRVGHDAPVPTPARTRVVLPDGQARVSGTATAVAVDADVVEPVAVPFTLDAPAATVRGVLVDGARESVAWNGGVPFTVEGTGPGLEASPAHLDVTPDEVVVALDGTPRPLLAGAYRTAAPVAVGTGGLATPRDGVAFTADRQTTVEATGHIRTGRRAMRIGGPGRVSATGTFTVTTRDGDRTATTLVFGPGPFELALTPVAGGWTLTATLQGPLDARKG